MSCVSYFEINFESVKSDSNLDTHKTRILMEMTNIPFQHLLREKRTKSFMM